MPKYTFRCEERHEFTEWFSYSEYDKLELSSGIPCEVVATKESKTTLCFKLAHIVIDPIAFRIRDIHIKITPEGTIDVQPEVW